VATKKNEGFLAATFAWFGRSVLTRAAERFLLVGAAAAVSDLMIGFKNDETLIGLGVYFLGKTALDWINPKIKNR
jgi:hypothetical protein